MCVRKYNEISHQLVKEKFQLLNLKKPKGKKVKNKALFSYLWNTFCFDSVLANEWKTLQQMFCVLEYQNARTNLGSTFILLNRR